MFLLLNVKTEVDWIDETAKTPIFGGLFMFFLIFIPPALLSFMAQMIVPGLHNNVGFTKAMLFLLPTWNLSLWLLKVKLYLFFLPTWILFGIISIIKTILLVKGIDDGQ